MIDCITGGEYHISSIMYHIQYLYLVLDTYPDIYEKYLILSLHNRSSH